MSPPWTGRTAARHVRTLGCALAPGARVEHRRYLLAAPPRDISLARPVHRWPASHRSALREVDHDEEGTPPSQSLWTPATVEGPARDDS
jgi:hypothetical protein